MRAPWEVPLALALAATGAALGAELRCVQDKDTLTVRAGDRPLVVYRHTPAPLKCYVQELRSPAGRQVLLDSPHDHVHHHALMFAIGADDVDFWGEFPRHKPGKQQPRGDLKARVAEGEGRSRAVLEQTLEWLRPGEEPLLVEHRAITVYAPEEGGATLLSWSTRLAPAPGRAKVRLWGRHYFGLGLRVVRALDKGTFLRPAKDPGKAVRGSEKVARAPWCAYTAPLDGRPVTVAMLDHPANPRHPATWFTMNAPFGYLSATLDLKGEPIVLAAERWLHVVYGVAVLEGEADAEQLGALYRHWTARAPRPQNPLE